MRRCRAASLPTKVKIEAHVTHIDGSRRTLKVRCVAQTSHFDVCGRFVSLPFTQKWYLSKIFLNKGLLELVGWRRDRLFADMLTTHVSANPG